MPNDLSRTEWRRRSTMERTFGGQPAGTPWKQPPSAVDSRPANVDGTAPSVDERAATLDTPRNYILWCARRSQPKMLWFPLDCPYPATYCRWVALPPDDPRNHPRSRSQAPREQPESDRQQRDPADGPAATRHPHPRDRGPAPQALI